MNAVTFETVVPAQRKLEPNAITKIIVEEITMQQALQIQTLVDQATVNAIPALKPFLGHKVQMIALDLGQPDADQAEKKITFEQFLATRPEWPKDRPPVTLEEMEEAIIQGALDSANL